MGRIINKDGALLDWTTLIFYLITIQFFVYTNSVLSLGLMLIFHSGLHMFFKILQIILGFFTFFLQVKTIETQKYMNISKHPLNQLKFLMNLL